MRKGMILVTALGCCLLLFFTSIFRKDPSDISQDQKVSIERTLSALPQEERKNLEYVFEHLFFFDQFSYPLFGTKPMSIACLLPTNETRIGWEAWKKIAPLFCSKKFVIREYIFNGHRFALSANLDKVEEIYNNNIDLFSRSFNGRMTLEALKICLKEENSLFQELMRDDICLGVLLGYGRRNSELFANNKKISKEKRFPLESFSIGHPIFYYFSAVMPVYFACDPNSEETKDLKKRYKTERANIVDMAKRDKLFTRMLVVLKT